MEKKEESGTEPLKDSDLEQVKGGTNYFSLKGQDLVFRPDKNKGSIISTPATGKNKPAIPLTEMIVDTPVLKDSSADKVYLA